MDTLLSIATGLAVRMFFDSLNSSLGRFGPALVGLWEGVAVHYQCTTNSSSSTSLDQSLAYALRIAVDFYFTLNPLRELITLLFTVLGLVASANLNPTRSRRRVHHRRSAHSSVSIEYDPEPLTVFPTTIRPIRPGCPSTLPSLSLERKSRAILASPENLTEPSTESIDGLPTFSNTSSLTPPYTLSAGQDDHVFNRLPSFEGHHGGEEGTQRPVLVVVPETDEADHTPPHAPSVIAPLPVPNMTIQSIPMSATPATKASYPAEALPLPIPNISTKYYTSEDDGDLLQTPPPRGLPRCELLTDDDGGLTTPLARELSPLPLEPALPPCFGQASASVEAAVPSLSAITTAMDGATTQPVPFAVEYSPVVPQRDPDPVSEPTLDYRLFKPKPNPEPEPEPELHPNYSAVGRDNFEQARRGTSVRSSPNGKCIAIEDTEQETETETETDTASMISSHPAKIMYTRAEALRIEARTAEAERTRLQEGMKHVHGVEMLFLKQQMQEQEDLARKLHDKAARRFFKGEWCISVILNKPFVSGWLG
ncbi:hypothetical protein C0992_005955 [Termitomyces sp. T32_za158]|nr:hypothetical protein C0992_005955 [Termitomyces sp. T32_za158]